MNGITNFIVCDLSVPCAINVDQGLATVLIQNMAGYSNMAKWLADDILTAGYKL